MNTGELTTLFPDGSGVREVNGVVTRRWQGAPPGAMGDAEAEYYRRTGQRVPCAAHLRADGGASIYDAAHPANAAQAKQFASGNAANGEQGNVSRQTGFLGGARPTAPVRTARPDNVPPAHFLHPSDALAGRARRRLDTVVPAIHEDVPSGEPPAVSEITAPFPPAPETNAVLPKGADGNELRGASGHFRAAATATIGEVLPAAPFVRGSQTSHDAAAAVDATGQGERQRARVLAAIVAAGSRGLTDDEGAAALGLNSHSYGPRRLELVTVMKVFKSTLRRPTKSGSMAFAYMAREAANAELF